MKSILRLSVLAMFLMSCSILQAADNSSKSSDSSEVTTQTVQQDLKNKKLERGKVNGATDSSNSGKKAVKRKKSSAK